ncbi:MAG: phospholipase D family protein [Desulfobacteraceae bacterium]|nr:phospholipase D family protein [Desulfobacteraceae bacterium]
MTTFKICKISVMLVVAGLLAGCATVSFDQPKSYSIALTNTGDTRLGKAVADWTALHEGLSGFYPLTKGMDALGVRLRLAERAQKSIDLQYFLMKNDTAGAVMVNALLKSADRGVRVRFLLDDIFTTVPDRTFLLMDQHPNIEIRIFNPLSRRGIWAFNYIGDFSQANRRMHNKSFTVDNAISVVGGRNIADEYFQLKKDSVFVDFDVLALGPIVADISKSFDQYWNHSRAVPVEQFITAKKNEDLQTVRANVAAKLDDIYETVYRKALNSQLLQDLIADRQPLFVGPARVLADNPDKLINKIDEAHMQLAKDLSGVVRRAETEIIFISPYYVPGDRGVQLIRDLVAKGVRVVILTNSLASNNHVPVHSAYARYRRDVVKAGAELYEMRANAARELEGDEKGPEVLTLHTKAFLIDRRYLFVGSLNLDPRSIEINAEMGLLIDCEPMVRTFTRRAEERLSAITYRVLVNDKGKLEWHTRIDKQEVIETKEPLTGWWLRFKAWFMKIAPESQL